MSGVSKLFQKKKDKKAGIVSAKAPTVEQQEDDGEWLGNAPVKEKIRVVTSGKIADTWV